MRSGDRTDPATAPAVAAFDVDGTLTRRDCVVPFLIRVRGRGRLIARMLRRPLRLTRAAARRDRDGLKALATAAAFTGVRRDEVLRLGRAFGGEVARTGLRDDTLARLRWHRDCGHAVVLVSASYEAYLDEIADRIGADAVLGTRLHVSAAGICTGRLDGPNCRGEEKAVRLRRWLADHGAAGAVLWAYGDSAGDDALLAMADHPVRVDGVVLSPAPDAGS